MFKQEGWKIGWEEGWEIGWKIGWEEGWEIGRDNAFVQCLENVMNSLSVSIEQAMDVLKVPMEQRDKYRGLVKRQ